MRHSVPTLIVPKKGTTLLKVANTRLYDVSTDAVNLAVGQLGLFTPVQGSGNPVVVPPAAAYTATNNLQVIMARNMAGDKSPLVQRPFEKSEVISRSANKITLTSQLALSDAALMRNDAEIIGSASSASGESIKINYTDESTFEIRTVVDGYYPDKYFGKNEYFERGIFTTPDWTTIPSIVALGAAAQIIAKRDWVVKSLVSNYNDNSKASCAICLSDTAPAVTGYVTLATLANTANVGTTYTIGYDTTGAPVTLKLSTAICYSFKKAIANGVASTTAVIPYTLNPTATSLSAPQIAAFGVGNSTALEAANRIMILALSTQSPYFDYVTNTKTRIWVGLSAGFATTVPVTKVSLSSTGAVTGAYVKANYYPEQNYNRYTGYGAREFESMFIEYPTEILADHFYDLITIQHYFEYVGLNGHPSVECKETVIALVNTVVGDANTNPGYTGSTNPLLIDLLGTPAAGPYTSNYVAVTTSSTTGLLTAWVAEKGGSVQHMITL